VNNMLAMSMFVSRSVSFYQSFISVLNMLRIIITNK